MLDKLPQTILESVTLIPLPPLPQVLVRFLALVEDERTSMSDLAALVAKDPAFTAQLITVSASPPYRQATATHSLDQSLSAIGIPLLRTLASCLAVQNASTHTIYERNFDYTGFWYHSLRVAAVAKSLAAATGYQDVEEAYLAGLLHDIGQLLLVGGIGFCNPMPGDSGSEPGMAELSHICGSLDHALVGSRLLESWQLCSFMADAVLFHQSPVEQIGTADLLCRIVWSAHRLSCCTGELDATIDSSPDINAIPAILGIDLEALFMSCQSSFDQTEELAVSLGLQIPRVEKVLPDTRFIYPYISMPKRDVRDAAQSHLDALVRNLAVMQPLQESLISLPSEADLYSALRETARLLFGLHRPVFLIPGNDRPVLVAASCSGQPLLLNRLEFSLDPEKNLAALAFQSQRACSSFAEDEPRAVALIDIQLARLLGSQGLLCIPMNNGAQQIGVMVFGLSEEQYAGRRRLIEWLTGFARLAARCLGMYHALRERDLAITADLTRQFEQKARNVIHEAVNPLGIINNYLNIFAEKLGNAPEVQQELTILKEEISRVERIVRRLNDLPEHPSPIETVNVNNLIEGMLALYGESLFESRGIGIEKQLASGIPPVRADRDSLKQILFNLWKNSAEAMPGGGSFRISTCCEEQGITSSCVAIRLSDSGPGMPPDVMKRLFQPLAPDRRPANSGVGLSIVASLVERLDGQISCDSSPGTGTTFTIRLEQA